jgi:hypothetical protein
VLDISIVITALPKIHRTLDFSPVALSWVQNAYLLTFGGLLLSAPASATLSVGDASSSSAAACSPSPPPPSGPRRARRG